MIIIDKINKIPTRKDVAKLAGVSETIVSYVINNNRYVDKAKKERTLWAIRELNYEPNPMARGLKNKSANHIAFIVNEITNEHFGRVVKEMEKYAYEKGYLISLFSSRNDNEFIRRIINRQFDGIVIGSSEISEANINTLANSGLPIVLLENRILVDCLPGIPRINTGLYEGAYNAVSYLISKGKKDIVYIDKLRSNRTIQKEKDFRINGYYAALKDNNIKIYDYNIIDGCDTYKQLSQKLIERVKSSLPIDAVFARNDNLAVIAMGTLSSLGIKIPYEISVMGFDNSYMSEYTIPPLTSVEINREEIAKTAIEMLVKLINNEQVDSVKLSTKIIERESA